MALRLRNDLGHGLHGQPEILAKLKDQPPCHDYHPTRPGPAADHSNWISRIASSLAFLSKDALTRWLRRNRNHPRLGRQPAPGAGQPAGHRPRLTGLEDSSRGWSASMVLQHLVIVDTIRQLAKARPAAAASAAAAHRRRQADSPRAEQHAQLRAAVDDTPADRPPRRFAQPLCHAHPWTGQLDLRTLACHGRHARPIVVRCNTSSPGNSPETSFPGSGNAQNNTSLQPIIGCAA
jgi:hypothetical protein